MWPNYVVCDNYLSKKHFDSISNIEFDTKPDEWDIYKHMIFKDGKIKTGFQSSTGASSYTAEEIRGYGAKNRIPKKVTEKMLRQHKHIKSNSPLSEEKDSIAISNSSTLNLIISSYFLTYNDVSLVSFSTDFLS